MLLPSYRTLDGSLVTELIRPEADGGSPKLSLAEAAIKPGQRTHRHIHRTSDEAYYILSGEGLLTVAALQRPVHQGEAHLIKAGTEHCIACVGAEPLRIICCCAPPYQHDDTILTEAVLA